MHLCVKGGFLVRIYDTIAKKRDGLTLTDEEIEFFVEEFVKGNVTDYQASALLMAIYIRGMDIKETSCLTKAMAHSGDIVPVVLAIKQH